MPKISLRSATLWAAVAQYSGFALQFVASVIIARYFLGPAEIGVFSVAFSAAALVHGLQDFGLTRFLVGEPQLAFDQQPARSFVAPSPTASTGQGQRKAKSRKASV